MADDRLFPYQESGAAWLADRNRAILGDVPGVGKTRTVLRALEMRACPRTLVLCPAVAVDIWREEAAVMGYPAGRLLIVSYNRAVARPSVVTDVASFPFDALVLDEGHYLKHLSAKRTRLAFGLAQRTHIVWLVTGTPMPRHPGELYPVFRYFWPDVLAEKGIESYLDWLNTYTTWFAGEYGPRVTGVKNGPELVRLLETRMLRRSEADVLPDLPPIMWSVYPLTHDAETERAVNDVVAGLSSAERTELLTPNAAPSANTAAARHAIGRLKAPHAAALIRDELLNGNPDASRIVFAYHRDVLDILEDLLRSVDTVVRVDGATSLDARRAAREAFQRRDARIYLGQIEAAGIAQTLTASAHVDIVEPDWRSDLNYQAGKRAHRIGQTTPVFVRFLALARTLDDVIVRQHHREVKMVKEIVGL